MEEVEQLIDLMRISSSGTTLRLEGGRKTDFKVSPESVELKLEAKCDCDSLEVSEAQLSEEMLRLV